MKSDVKNMSHREALIALEELNTIMALKEDLIGTFAQELRTRLCIILGWAEYLREHSQHSPGSSQAIDVIERNAKWQASLTENLLNASRVLAAKLSFHVNEFLNLNEILAEVFESARPAADRKGLELKWDLSEELMISSDPEYLRQILWNLVSNAINFSRKGAVVKIHAELRESLVHIETDDSGIGIKTENLVAVFERIVQADPRSISQGGLGFGLSIVKALAELQGGRVEAFSAGTDRGSRFVVTIPTVMSTNHKFHEPGSDLINKAKSRQPLNGVRLLIVVHQTDFLHALQIFCESTGCVVKAARNGIEALKLLHSHQFDVVLSDTGITGMTAHEMLRIWRTYERKNNKIPVAAIALMAGQNPNDCVSAFLGGFSSYVPKPISGKELISMIVSIVNRGKESQQI